ncbi:MAG TPA: M28 family peptidase [Longimicrobiales bacterium]|nr:M28 family peptidase [Longimicrobiales bacterium]
MRFRRMPRLAAAVFSLVVAAVPARAQTAAAPPLPLQHAPQPTGPAITAADLMTRLYIFADDSMMGRQAGTPGNVKGTNYIAAEVQRLGLQPAGDSGTFFQTLPMAQRKLQPGASISVGGAPLALSKDVVALPGVQGLPFGFSFKGTDVPVVFGGRLGGKVIPPAEAAGKLVVFLPPLGPDGKPSWQFWRASEVFQYGQAAAIGIASLDETPTGLLDGIDEMLVSVGAQGMPDRAFALGLVLSSAAAERLLGKPLDQLEPGAAGSPVTAQLDYASGAAVNPARNVVAILPGSDPKLKGEYVAIGAHNDHIGMGEPLSHDSLKAFNIVMRPAGAESTAGVPTPEQEQRIRAVRDSLLKLYPERRDSVFNGADDDGSGSMSVLEIAQRLATSPKKPRRSILFVWHTGEELGLLGSQWFTEHPTVPRDSIVAQLNIDMIGRGEGTGAAGVRGDVGIIGLRRLSTQLGDVIEAVNAQGPKLKFDYQYDATGHPQQYYCRSDHYMYARFGIPIAFFFTGAHMDYHQRTDEPEYIDYPHMAKVANFIGDVALALANRDERPLVDHPKPDPQGACRQ